MQLYFKGEKLPNKDSFSKSDPYCVLYSASTRGGRGPEIGRTETLDNNLNPEFKVGINVTFIFETKQEFQVVVYDDDNAGDKENDVLAIIPFELSRVVGSRNHTASFDIPESGGKLFISAVEIHSNAKDTVELQFVGRALKNMDTFSKSDPYFVLSRTLPNGTRIQLHRSKVIDDCLDPVWDRCPRFTLEQLAGPRLDEPTLDFECYDEDVVSDEAMGHFKCSVQQLIDVAGKSSGLTLRDDTSKEEFGEILVRMCQVTHIPTFVEYLRGGQQINLAVSIDFTGSNGAPTDPKSLHFMDPLCPNQYARAITSVADILLNYDYDKMVPVFGFGGYLPSGQTSHFFNVSLTDNPYVSNVQGILDVYSRCLTQVRLSGPTNFAPTITAVQQGARNAEVYTVLLILTDGEITDMQDTIDALVEASTAPLSIVIVGVGNGCDFSMMNALDGDDGALRSSSGRVAARDIVQFVPFRNYVDAPPGALAAEVLREIPSQFLKWAAVAGVRPRT